MGERREASKVNDETTTTTGREILAAAAKAVEARELVWVRRPRRFRRIRYRIFRVRLWLSRRLEP